MGNAYWIEINVSKMNKKSNKVKNKANKKAIGNRAPSIEEQEANRRADWEHNNEIIYSVYMKIALEKRRVPKLREVAEQTGLDITTVWKHTQAPDFDTMKKKYSVFADAALFKLAAKAVEAENVQWAELFFKVVVGIGDKKQLDVTSTDKSIKIIVKKNTE